MDSLDDLCNTNFDADLSGGFNELSIVSFFRGHSPCPETPEVVVQNLFSNVSRLHTITANNLLQNFKHNFPHFFFWSLKLTNQCRHYGSCVLRSMSRLH